MSVQIKQKPVPIIMPPISNTLNISNTFNVKVLTSKIKKNVERKIYPTIKESIPSVPFYRIKKPATINVVQNALQLAVCLQNESVRTQTIKLLNNLDRSLNDAVNVSEISNRLPKIHLTEQEDGSALAEWNFEYFRIGFSIEPEQSSYYLISDNKTTGSFKAETHRLDMERQEIISKIINFVLVNS
jgi:hypothetical protein